MLPTAGMGGARQRRWLHAAANRLCMPPATAITESPAAARREHLHAVLLDRQAQLVQLLHNLRVVPMVLADFFNGVHALRQQQALCPDPVHKVRRQLPGLDFLPRREPAEAARREMARTGHWRHDAARQRRRSARRAGRANTGARAQGAYISSVRVMPFWMLSCLKSASGNSGEMVTTPSFVINPVIFCRGGHTLVAR